MTTTLPLRRSKRKQNEQAQAAALIPNTRDTAPPPRKRARKANIPLNTEPCIPENEHAKPVRPQQYDTLPPFLALPRELRDEIYKHVLEQDESSTLKTGRGNNIVTRCGLVGVNNQISEEFLDAVLFHAHVITATIRNHNFAHVVTFLNRLSQAQLARLSAHGPTADEVDDDRKPKRKIRIILSYSAGAKDSRVHLNRWLDRFDAPDKRGKEIEFEYHNDGTYRNGGYKQRPRIRGNASQRWNDEAAKIGRGAARGKAWGGWGGYGGYRSRH
ncbi:hypothetical protein COCCADRAFT_109695 [Bipolaris zeicola 26-R-13]|uniref:F-box domain-containing protein n=1 Tax=Cochliobolus carbonum (strain 26-R-13) TaxID=930089 RepID=W6XSH3_COCC2|nr:uncharacterized protein COCCADRAFT_109695 [Bipolaris zeicola 26-R-13]EUC28235.1 hypothetical protein COCCADRAFT_109695 [Bipolaris zeicola 26-R-13]